MRGLAGAHGERRQRVDHHRRVPRAAPSIVGVLDDGAPADLSEQELLRWQLEALHRLAHEYRSRAVEVREAAMRIFPLAHSAVVHAGGALMQANQEKARTSLCAFSLLGFD